MVELELELELELEFTNEDKDGFVDIDILLESLKNAPLKPKANFLKPDPIASKLHLKMLTQDNPLTRVTPIIKTTIKIKMLPNMLNLGNKLKRKILPTIPPAPCGT